MMTTAAPRHIGKTIRVLEAELAAMEARRDEITRAIETLRPLAGEPARRARKASQTQKRGPYKKRAPKEAP